MGRVDVPGSAVNDVVTVTGALAHLTKLLWDADLDSPSLDARILVAEALHASAEDLIRDPGRMLTAAERAAVQSFADRRLAREPVSRILWAHVRSDAGYPRSPSRYRNSD
jgi:methylase of polypeptide subunit release factors